MFGKKKRKTVSSFVISAIFLAACSTAPETKIIRGEAQGTTYSITLPDGETISKEQIDSLLARFDQSLSTYDSNSVLSKLNEGGERFNVPESDVYLIPCLKLSQQIYNLTSGAFDPTVFPLIKAWGFFKEMDNIPSTAEIESLLNFVGFDKIELQNRVITKKDGRIALDFNAIAQGYSVDVVSAFLEEKGVLNYFVEIGGEIRVKGFNPEGNKWRVGVDVPTENPKEDVRELQDVLEISDCGIATSGNYRKFYIKDGKKYAHTLNPKTGMPAETDLLSATVIAKTAGEADGLATAFMVMGTSKTKKWLASHPEIKVYLISRGENGKSIVFQN